jgi:transmembrane sensor
MAARTTRQNSKALQRIDAEAAVWVIDLHSPDRDEQLESRVRRWIADDPRHAAAFEQATDDWRRNGNIPWFPLQRVPESTPGRRRMRTTGAALAGMAALCAALACTLYFLRDDTLATGPSEQRIVDLSDGSQVTLNANSRVVVQFDEGVRKITLKRGEALFDVAKDRARPFVVIAGDRKVIAVGTSFEVRREEPAGSTFAVTLMEGRVAIEPISWPDTLPSAAAAGGAKLLNPGQRLRFTGERNDTLDSPSIEKVTAWRRGELIFDDASLSDAAAEFNRYGIRRLEIEGPAARTLRVGGVFGIRDPYSFAQSMASTYHLRIITRGNTIILTDRSSDSSSQK